MAFQTAWVTCGQSPSFPVDAVFTWVDGTDPVWREQKSRLWQRVFGESLPQNDADDTARFQDNGELRYALRSLERFAPWIRRVHLVTMDQKPVWLNTATVSLVSHRDIFPDDVPLPVFSSHPIGFCIHRVPGLAERFIYLSDDYMFGRPMTPGDFFLPDGSPLQLAAKLGKKSMQRMLDRLTRTHGHAPAAVAKARSHKIIIDRYAASFPYYVRHFPKPMVRESAAALWEAFPEEIGATLRSPFRSPADVRVGMLYPLFLLAEGKGEVRAVNGLRQVWDFFRGRGLAHLGASLGDPNFRSKTRAIKWLRPRTFSLNDAPWASETDRRMMREFLAEMFPEPSRYEVPVP